MAKPISEEPKSEPVIREVSAPKPVKASVVTPVITKAPVIAKEPKPKPVSDGVVYLILSKNGKYRELRESQLIKEASTILKDPTLRLFKGQHLVPHITFKPQGE